MSSPSVFFFQTHQLRLKSCHGNKTVYLIGSLIKILKTANELHCEAKKKKGKKKRELNTSFNRNGLKRLSLMRPSGKVPIRAATPA